MWERGFEAFNAVCVAAALLTLGIATALPVCAQLQPAKIGRAVAYGPASQATSVASKLGENERASVPMPMAFDVVSIKPSKRGEMDSSLRTTGDEFSSINRSLGATILMAYFPMPLMSRERLVGTPDWVWKEKYDFVGKVYQANSTKAADFRELWGLTRQSPLLQAMLQAALAERCQLVVHRSPAEAQGYALVVESHGPNWKHLKAAKPGETIPAEALRIAGDGRMIPYQRGSENPTLRFFQTSMKSLAADLGSFGLVVVDKTGLTGTYDFALMKLGSGGDLALEWDLHPLGLRLVPVKIPTENIVIDHIERPSPN